MAKFAAISAGIVAPSISANGIVNGASVQPGLVVGWWGTDIARATVTWDVVNGVLPMKVHDVTVTVGGNDAYVYFVSATQVNFIVPDVPAGSQSVTVTNSAGTSAAETMTIESYAPAFFTWPNNQVVAATQSCAYVAASGTFSGVTTTPAKPGDTIILWGTGFGATIQRFRRAKRSPAPPRARYPRCRA